MTDRETFALRILRMAIAWARTSKEMGKLLHRRQAHATARLRDRPRTFARQRSQPRQTLEKPHASAPGRLRNL